MVKSMPYISLVDRRLWSSDRLWLFIPYFDKARKINYMVTKSSNYLIYFTNAFASTLDYMGIRLLRTKQFKKERKSL
jgi:hypothetical protein